jgi:hypothetical protein
LDREKVHQVLKEMPEALKCKAGEVLCLVDSGATVNAAWISKHFPAFAKLLRETAASRRGDAAVTANGSKLYEKGSVNVTGKIGNQDAHINFRDMEVELPILSVRKMVKKGNQVLFDEGGGFITNRATGARIRFFEYAGAYYLKLEVGDPDAANLITGKGKGKTPGFARPGR